MLDLFEELTILKLLPLQVGTGTITGAAKLVSQLDTGDLDAASLNVVGIAGTGTVTVQLQESLNGTSGWVNIPTTALMPNTAFPAVAANLTGPSLIPIDPRAIGPYIRAVSTVSGITGFTLECVLYCRLLQIGFTTTSG